MGGLPDQTTVYEWIKYNEDIDPKMASAAEAWAAAARAKHANELLVETSTDIISLPGVAFMVFFVGIVLALAVHSSRGSAPTENKEAFIAGYSPFNS